MKYTFWWILAFLLIFADAGITYWAVTGGHAAEANPTVKDAMDSHGIVAALIGGAALRSASLVLAMVVQRFLPYYKWTMPLIGVTVQAPPVIWNIFILV